MTMRPVLFVGALYNGQYIFLMVPGARRPQEALALGA